MRLRGLNFVPWLTLALSLAIGVIVVVAASDSASQANTAASANAAKTQSKVGACEKAFRRCVLKGTVALQQCENTWKKCVEKKCVAKKTGKNASCPADADCESSCTEAVRSDFGLVSCCVGGPEHDNFCPKMIDGKCYNRKGLPSAMDYMPSYKEGEPIRSDHGTNPGDQRLILPPAWPLQYPEGTVFDENGVPSNPPSPNAVAPGNEVKPSWDFSMHQYGQQLGDQSLPPEYRPEVPYVPPSTAKGLGTEHVSLNGTTYSMPIADPSARPSIDAPSSQAQNTFAAPVEAPVAPAQPGLFQRMFGGIKNLLRR